MDYCSAWKEIFYNNSLDGVKKVLSTPLLRYNLFCKKSLNFFPTSASTSRKMMRAGRGRGQKN